MSRFIKFIGCLLALCIAIPSLALTSVASSSIRSSSSSSQVCAGLPTSSTASSSSAVSALTCNVRVVNQWSTGYQIEVTVKNNGNVKIDNWKVYLSVPEFHLITSLWNAAKTDISPTQILLSNYSWSPGLLPGQSVSIGVMFNKPLNSTGVPSCRTEILPPPNTAPQGDFSIQLSNDTVYVKTVDAVDAEGDKLTYRLDFGDGTSLVAPYAWHTYKTPGTYTITQTISDGKLSKVTQHSVTTTAAGINRAPVAIFSYYTNGLNASTNARASSDRDGDELTYAWDFGHGVGVVSTAVSHSSTVGNGYVTLTVFDGQLGNTVQYQISTRACVHSDSAPQIAFTHVINGNTTELDASESKNVDSFTWDFGDGTSTASGMFVNHTYAAPGTYTLTLRANAQMIGGSKTEQIVIVDNNSANLVPVAELSCREEILVADDFVNGASYQYFARCDASASYDPEAKPLSYRMNWGDGTSNESTTGMFFHNYATGGEFDLTLQVSDGEKQTEKVLHWIATAPTTSNRTPIACFDFALGENLSLNAACSSDADGDSLTYAWDFGDGSNATGATATHSYAASGSYVVKLSVSDGKTTNSLNKTVEFIKTAKATRCEFKINNVWNTGFNGWLRVYNQSTSPVSNWGAQLIFATDNGVSAFWNGTVTGSNPYQVSSAAWNNTISPGGFVEVGFQVWGPNQPPQISGISCE